MKKWRHELGRNYCLHHCFCHLAHSEAGVLLPHSHSITGPGLLKKAAEGFFEISSLDLGESFSKTLLMIDPFEK